MTNPVVIDSSVLASFFKDNDDNHDQAVACIRQIFIAPDEPTVIIPPLVLYETCVAAVRAETNVEVLADRIYKLLNIEQVTTVGLSELSVFKHLRRTERTKISQPQLRTHDMLIVGTALEFDASLASFDQNMNSCCARIGVSLYQIDPPL